MAIEQEISVGVTGTGSVNALAGALDKASESAAKLDESLARLKVPSLGSSGAGNMARGLDAAATKAAKAAEKFEASFARIKEASAEAAGAMGDIGKAGAESAAGLGDAAKGANDAATSYARLGKASRDSAAMMDEQAVAGRRAGKSSAEASAGGTKFWGGLKTVMIGTGIAAAYGIDKAMQFQSQMLLLHTQAGVSTGDVKKMSQGALQISTQTGQSLSDVAESAYHVASNMASMGTSVPKMLQATKIAAEGASVGHANMVDTTNALTAAIASGIPGVKDYSQAMGVLNKTVGSGDMSMQDLADAFGTGMVASVKGYGLSIKDVGAGLAVLGDNNIRGAKAGTDLRMAVQSLAVPASSAKKELAGLGLTTGSLAKDMQSGGLLKALDDLQGRFRSHGITAKNEGQVITDLFGKKAGVGLSILMEQMDRVHSKYPELTASANGFNKAWQATQASPAQKWKETMAGLKASATGFGTELLPAFTKVTGFANKLLGDINGSKAGATAMAVSFGGIAALFAGKKLFSGVESAAGTLGKVGKFLNIPGLSKLSGIGGAGASGSLAAVATSGDAAAAALGRLAGVAGGEDLLGAAALKPTAAETAAVTGEGAATAGGAAGIASKIGPAIGTAIMTAGVAWAIGHAIGAPMGAPTRQDEQQYKKHMPGWAQAPANFIFGSKAASLYRDLPGGTTAAVETSLENWYHNVFGGGRNAPKPHMAEPAVVHRKNGDPFYGAPLETADRTRGTRHAGALPEFWDNAVKGFGHLFDSRGTAAAPQVSSPAFWKAGGAPAPIQRPAPPRPVFYGEVPQPGGAASQRVPQLSLGGHAAAASTVQVKVRADTSALSGDIGAAKGKLAALSQAAVKPVKIPAPDTSALDSAKGKAASAGTGITQAIQGAMKPAKMPPPNLSAAQAAAGKARGIGAGISGGLASGILSGEGAVVAAATQVGNAAAAAMAKGADTHSPSKKTIKTGKDLSAGIVIGLQGGQDAVNAAATALGKNAAKATDIAAIDNAAKKLLAQVPKGDTALTAMLRADNKALDSMANTRAKLESEIASSEQVAKSVIGSASVTNALNAVNPAGNEPVSSSAIVTGQGYQASTMKQYAAALMKLQKEGLNATALSQYAQADPAANLGAVQGLASGGKQSIRQLNQLQKQMQSSAAAIGNVAGPAMYQAGKDAGQGLAAGLKSELGSLDKAMEKLAKSMVASAAKHAKDAKAKAAKTAAGAAGSISAAGGTSSGSPAGGTGADSLMHAGAALSGAAAALTSAATALHKDATAGTVHAHPVASAASGGAHPVAAAAASRGHGGGVTVHNTTNVTVQGTVTAERDLLNSLQNMQLKRASNNHQGGWKLPGRGT